VRELLTARSDEARVDDDEPWRIGGHVLLQPAEQEPPEHDSKIPRTPVLVAVDGPSQRAGLIPDRMDLADTTAGTAAQLVGAAAIWPKALGAGDARVRTRLDQARDGAGGAHSRRPGAEVRTTSAVRKAGGAQLAARD